MRIGIKPDEKILTIEDRGTVEQYKFIDILLGKDIPVWKVGLVDGGVLILNFGDGIGGTGETN